MEPSEQKTSEPGSQGGPDQGRGENVSPRVYAIVVVYGLLTLLFMYLFAQAYDL